MPYAVCFGGPSPEHDISILTGLQAARALSDRGHEVIGLYWSTSGSWFRVEPDREPADFLAGAPRGAEPLRLEANAEGGFVADGGRLKGRRRLPIDALVNCCHGGPGEDGALQGALDLAGIPYTGPSAIGAALGMDKLAFGALMGAHGIPTLPRVALDADTASVPVEGALIVKPRFGGSSIGIEVVEDLDTARALAASSPLLADGAVVEPYRSDAIDLNISVRTAPHREFSAIERPLRAPDGRIYTYAEKYLQGGEGMASAPRELPATLDTAVEARIRELADQVARLALVRSVARIDFLLVGDEVMVNEINTIPGAMAWYFWAHDGVPFAQLLEDMISEARTRAFPTTGADGTALRSAGSIAAKLG